MPMLTQVITIPANTLSSDPHIDYLDLMVGHLYRVDIGFQDGCNNLVFIQVFNELIQVIPYLAGQVLNWNDHIFSVPLSIDITNTSKQLSVAGWSDGTLYDHEIYFWMYFDEIADQQQPSVMEQIYSYVPLSETV